MLDVIGDDSVAHARALAEIAGRYKARFAQHSALLMQSSTRAYRQRLRAARAMRLNRTRA